jgi:hypothetical protein
MRGTACDPGCAASVVTVVTPLSANALRVAVVAAATNLRAPAHWVPRCVTSFGGNEFAVSTSLLERFAETSTNSESIFIST